MTRLRLTSTIARAQAGFSLIELMVALTIGLVLVGATMTIFINSNQSRQIVEQVGQQVDNGAYAMQVLTTDLSLAGYVGELDMTSAGLTVPTSLPDPCDTTVSDYHNYLTLPVQGYDMYATSTLSNCVSDIRANTDIVVVRRVSDCVNTGTTGACPTESGAPYFQASLCENQAMNELYSSNVYGGWFKIDNTVGNLTLHGAKCASTANLRRYITDIYFIANNDQPGDGIPTLKCAELGGSNNSVVFTTVPIAEGVENMQLDYGLDNTLSVVGGQVVSSNLPTAGTPSKFYAAPGATDWARVMAVKIHLLVRDTTAQKNYQDTKTYTLGLKADGTANVIAAANDAYKRHVFTAETRLFNPSTRYQGSN